MRQIWARTEANQSRDGRGVKAGEARLPDRDALQVQPDTNAFANPRPTQEPSALRCGWWAASKHRAVVGKGGSPTPGQEQMLAAGLRNIEDYQQPL